MKTIPFSILTILLIVLLFFLSCSKDNTTTNSGNNNPPNMTYKRVDKEIENGVTKRTFYYDTNGRCTSIVYPDRTLTYAYNGAKIIATLDFNSSTQSDIVQTYTLNNVGLASSCTYESNGKYYLVEYQYDANKHLLQKTTKHNSLSNPTYIKDNTFIYTYNAKGDCIKYVYQLEFTNVIYQYEYDENRTNTLSNKYHGLEWLGEIAEHMPKTYIVTTGFYPPDWNSKTDFTYYNWTYDAQGYGVQNIETGANSDINTYTYK